MSVLFFLCFACVHAWVDNRQALEWTSRNRSFGHQSLRLKKRDNLEVLESIDACWEASSWSVNPGSDPEVDKALQGLVSPAPQSLFVLCRAVNQSFSLKWVFDSCYHLIKFNYTIIVNPFVSNSSQLGVDWKIVSLEEGSLSGWCELSRPSKPFNCIQLAKLALDYAEETSHQQRPVDDEKMDKLVERVYQQLCLSLGTDIRGRSCADTAFTLALAGVQDEGIYQLLSRVTAKEIERVGARKSRRGKDILQIVEKLAASGVTGDDATFAYREAVRCLQNKGPKLDPDHELNDPTNFDNLSERPLLWLWRYATGVKKPVVNKAPLSQSSLSTHWTSQFQDAWKPLVADVGCGFGTSLLGLSLAQGGSCAALAHLHFQDCNSIGCDLGHQAIRYAGSMTYRRGVQDRLQFTMTSAESLVDDLNKYPGPIGLIMIQFPTPYRLPDRSEMMSNQQLPASAEDGFMIPPRLMEKIGIVMQGNPECMLMIQSNCEDVAIALKRMAEDSGMCAIPALVRRSLETSTLLSQRSKRWREMGGEAATGPDWHLESILPPKCASETEVACRIKGTPVYRCLFALRRES